MVSNMEQLYNVLNQNTENRYRRFRLNKYHIILVKDRREVILDTEYINISSKFYYELVDIFKGSVLSYYELTAAGFNNWLKQWKNDGISIEKKKRTKLIELLKV